MDTIGTSVLEAIDRIHKRGVKFPPEEEIQRRERDLRGDMRRAHLMESGIRPRLEEGDAAIIMAGPDKTPAFVRVEAWLWQLTHPSERRPTWGPWLWLGGPPSVGKTLAAAWALAEVGGRYVTMRELMLDTEREHRRRAGLLRAPASWSGRYAGQCLVVLDEVGQEDPEGASGDALARSRGMARAALHDFVDHRKRSTTPTIVLTNKTAASIRQRFKEGVYDQRTEQRLRQLLTRDRETGVGLHDVGGANMRGEAI